MIRLTPFDLKGFDLIQKMEKLIIQENSHLNSSKCPENAQTNATSLNILSLFTLA